MKQRGIFIGFDERYPDAFAVARESARRYMVHPIPIFGLSLRRLVDENLYLRPTIREHDGHTAKLWDPISEAPMATEFAISRFLVPHLAKRMGIEIALFMDCDMLLRWDLGEVFNMADSSKAVMCVKHKFDPPQATKMDGQEQTRYARKNWSSFMLFNVNHPANAGLTLEMVNTLPGRDLHRFCWLKDDEIGDLPVEWNWLVGHSQNEIVPKNVHFTDGIPTIRGHEDDPYASEFFETLADWASFQMK